MGEVTIMPILDIFDFIVGILNSIKKTDTDTYDTYSVISVDSLRTFHEYIPGLARLVNIVEQMHTNKVATMDMFIELLNVNEINTDLDNFVRHLIIKIPDIEMDEETELFLRLRGLM